MFKEAIRINQHTYPRQPTSKAFDGKRQNKIKLELEIKL